MNRVVPADRGHAASGFVEEKHNDTAERLPSMPNPDPARFTDEEWRLRVDLAAAYRLLARFGMDDAIFTHLSLRVPAPAPTFLINPYGMTFDEITASSLVKIDAEGRKVGGSEWPVNPAGFDIHGAIHLGAQDAHCVMHTHTIAGMSVAAMPEGLLPLNQMALHFHDRIGRYSYDTIHFTPFEKARLLAALGTHRALILECHGLLTCGPTVADAFFRMYYLEQACRIQCRVTARGGPFLRIPDDAAEEGARLFESRPEQKRYMWAAFVRRLHRESPGFAT